MKTRSVCRLAIRIALALFSVSAASAGLVNGSFESGLVGWEWGGNVTVHSEAPYAPTDGASLVAFNAMNLPANGWIRQSMEVAPGREHFVEFDIGNLAYVNRSQKMRIEVTEESTGGTIFLIDQIVSIPGTTGGATVWAPLHGLGFTPSGSSVTLTFRDVSTTSESLDLVIDHVRLEKAITFVEVTTSLDENDSGLGLGSGNSLREVLHHVSTHPEVDEIRFSGALEGHTVFLEHGELEVRTPIVIDASQWAGSITIDAGGLSRVMHLWSAGEAVLRGLKMRGGNSVGPGGGLLIDSGPLMTSQPRVKIIDCTIEDNRTLESGGGIAVRSGGIEFTRTRIENNRAAIDAGGVWFSILILATFDSCLISENLAIGDGGGLQAGLSKIDIRNCTLANNGAGGFGGAIASHAQGPPYKSGWLALTNSTLAGNRSIDSGAAIQSVGTCSLVHCTVVGNRALESGSIHTPSGDLHLLNSIISAFPGSEDSISGIAPDLAGNNWLAGDPMLAPLADYGGAAQTMPPLPGSPVIDAAASLEGIPSIDQRGAVRPQGPLPDIGSVEAFPFAQLQPAADSDGDGMDDRIEPAYGLVVGEDDSQRDSDRDGSCDAEELSNMTDPNNPSSQLRICGMAEADGFDPVTRPVFDLWFPSFPGLHYTLECDQTLDFSPAHRRELDLGIATNHETRVRMILAPQRDFVRLRRDP